MPRSRKGKSTRELLGVTDEQYERLLAAQGGGCAICGNPPKTRRLHVDHDHKTGAVRGLLCYRCNRFLHSWMSGDWLGRAMMYVLHGGRLTCRAVLDEINAARQDGKS